MALSKIYIFSTQYLELINATRQIDLNNEYRRHHRIFNMLGIFIRMHSDYLLNFYQNMPNNKITNNNKDVYALRYRNSPLITHDLGFTLNTNINLDDIEYFQILTN
jgi:hypothetical protein